ncbi:hypothetical protein BGZ80_003304 [Entomortierella chlamydospora]|uniref:Uncharacterized protein n=1 Tax=Entomortierella chlamydospora TaxID=101097 RepID=A0A9P6SWJ7_9FUNG|nr:hypothetical protein BGZ80_003304 [Entomortierella chlamydospora]
MFRNLFPSRTCDLSPEEALELVNKRLELARKEDDSAKKLKLINNVKPRLKDTENIFVSKKVKDPALLEGIAHAYHEHETLLDDLGHHGKAKRSHSTAEKWGYVDVLGRDTGSSHPLGKSDTVRRSLLPTAALSAAPIVAVAMYQDNSKTDVAQLNNQDHIFHATPAEVNNSRPTPKENGMQIQQKILVTTSLRQSPNMPYRKQMSVLPVPLNSLIVSICCILQ